MALFWNPLCISLFYISFVETACPPESHIRENGYCLLLMKIETTTDDAHYLCNRYGGELPAPKNAEENRLFFRLLKEQEVYGSVHIGVHCFVGKCGYMNGDPIVFENWGMRGESKPITLNVQISSRDAYWEACDNCKRYFFCELPPHQDGQVYPERK